MPRTYAQSESGVVYIADGFHAVQRWDGSTAGLETAGVAPPASALTIGSSGAGAITGTYTAYQRFVDRLGNYSNLSPISNSISISAKGSIDYSSVPIPTSSQVTTRQILRNLNGNTTTYYLDVETTDLTSTSFSSTKADTTLAAQTAVPIQDSEGNDLAVDRFTVPPDDLPLLLSANGRILMAGEALTDEGAVAVTQSSATVTGIGTNWTSVVAGRYFTVQNETRTPILISSVNTATQTLTLASVWPGRTQASVEYGIRSANSRRRSVAWSEAGYPEAVPPTSLLSVARAAGIGDLTAMFKVGSLVYLAEALRVHTFSFVNDPQLSSPVSDVAGGDGQVFLSAYRGCVNQRCVVIVEDVAYLLDQEGIWTFRAGGSESASQLLQGFFDEHAGYDYRIFWEHSKNFHAVHDVADEVIRFFVCLDHRRYPHHCLAYAYRQQRWWMEEFPVPICSSCQGQINGQPVAFVGSSGGRVFTLSSGDLDGVDAVYTNSGTATSAGIQTLTDSGAVFDFANIVGLPVSIVDGTGQGQQRLVTSATATELTVDAPWLTALDTTSKYQIGGIQYRWRSGVFRYINVEKSNKRSLELIAQPADTGTASLRLYLNRSETPKSWGLSAKDQGVRTTRGEPDAELDLTRADGYFHLGFSGLRSEHLDGNRQLEVELSGVQGQDALVFHELTIDGVG